MEKTIMYVGLDVHKNSIDVALAESGRESEVCYYGTIGGDMTALGKPTGIVSCRATFFHPLHHLTPPYSEEPENLRRILSHKSCCKH